MTYNKCVLVGRLTKDPDSRFTVEGKPVTKFSIAVDRDFKREGEPDADFFNIVTFGKVAEICRDYLNKGKQVLVEGRIQIRKYTTDEGVDKWSTEIIASSMKMLGKKDVSEG